MSEQELLLLSNYAYFYCSTNGGTIEENIAALKNDDGTFNMEKVVAQGATGDIISEEDAIDILNRLEADESLAGLKMEKCVNSNGIRAILYTNESGDATLVFRGTGGTYRAWEDNVLGEYETDTKLQALAADFVKYECSGYKNITVTGHSKGGNLSQYVTVTCPDQINRCVSFDGQGFGSEFLEEYESEIAKAQGKITSISGYNDFVNILLTPIAGEILYVNNQEGISVDMHSCYTMLDEGVFDENGDFDRENGQKPQAYSMAIAKRAGSGIVTLLDALPMEAREKAVGIIGAYTAAAFSQDKGDEYEQNAITNAINEFVSCAEELLGIKLPGVNESGYVCEHLHINMESVKNIYSSLDGIIYEMEVYPEMVEDVLVGIDYSILGRSFTEYALKKVIKKMDKNNEMLLRFRDSLGEIIVCYEKSDSFT